jgi:hypothetical protein
MHVLFSILIYWTALSIVNCCPYTIVNCGSFNNGHFLYFLFLPLRSKNMLQDTIKYPMVISISICTSKNEKPYSPYLGLKKTCGSGSRPTLFFLPTYYFFNAIGATQYLTLTYIGARNMERLPKNGVCCHINYWTKLPKFVHRKYASLVNIDVGTLLANRPAKTRQNHEKKYSKKNVFPTYRS